MGVHSGKFAVVDNIDSLIDVDLDDDPTTQGKLRRILEKISVLCREAASIAKAAK